METHKLLGLEENKSWNDLLNRLPVAQNDIYYTPNYYSLYQNYGDGEAKCFVYNEGDNWILYPFLINSVNELGYNLSDNYFDIQGAYGYNGIISSSTDQNFIQRFHNCFDAYCKENNIIAEFTRFNPLLKNRDFASPNMQVILSRKTVILNLQDDLDFIWMNQISTKNRNIIRKAEKEGVIIVESSDYDIFRSMYNETMKNVSAEDYYFFPQSYFDEYKKSFIDDGILYLAIYDNTPIAGSMFMFSKDYAHYHLSARDKKYNKLAANNLILWHAIQKAKDRGCKWFHFGGGTTSSDEDRLLHFKQTFSHDTGDFWIGKRIHNQEVYDFVVSQWKVINPNHYMINQNKLLGYRDIKTN